MSTRTALKQRYRLGAATAAIILPLALTGCGSDDKPSGNGGTTGNKGSGSGDALGSINKGFDNLSNAKSASFELSFRDTDGKLAGAMTEDSPKDKGLAQVLLGGTIKVVIDPAGDATLGSKASVDPSKGLAGALTAGNFSLSVNADGADIAGIRLVKGVLYANVNLNKIDELAKKGGSTDGILNGIAGFTEGAPPQAAAAIKDVQDGKWLKLDLAPLANQFGGLLKGALPTATASAAADSLALVDAVKTAILSNTTATGKDGNYAVEIKAKETLTALTTALRSSGLPGVDEFDTTTFDSVGAGTLKGNVKLDGDSIKEISLDLDSVNELIPAEDKVATGLAGSAVVLTFDDDAAEVGVPDNVSSVDLNALLTSFIGQFAGAFGGLGGSTPS